MKYILIANIQKLSKCKTDKIAFHRTILKAIKTNTITTINCYVLLNVGLYNLLQIKVSPIPTQLIFLWHQNGTRNLFSGATNARVPTYISHNFTNKKIMI